MDRHTTPQDRRTDGVDETLKALIDSNAISLVTLSNGRRGAVDTKSGELLFVVHDEDDESSQEDDEDEVSPDPVETAPLVLVLHRAQSDKAVQGMILQAAHTLHERKNITNIRVEIEGYTTQRNPSQHKPIKALHAQACELGLLGMLATFGFAGEIAQIYAIAYAVTKKHSDGQFYAHGLQTPRAMAHFKSAMVTSIEAFQTLVKSATDAQNETNEKTVAPTE